MDKKGAIRNLICAGIFFLMSLFLIVAAIPQQISIGGGLMAEKGANSRVFPYFAAGVMCLASLAELAVNLVQYFRAAQTPSGKTGEGGREGRALVIFGLCALYAWLFGTIGYLLSTFIVAPVILYVMGSRKWPHYLSVCAVTVVMYFVFQYILNVQLP